MLQVWYTIRLMWGYIYVIMCKFEDHLVAIGVNHSCFMPPYTSSPQLWAHSFILARLLDNTITPQQTKEDKDNNYGDIKTE